jgi:hypothetical protein
VACLSDVFRQRQQLLHLHPAIQRTPLLILVTLRDRLPLLLHQLVKLAHGFERNLIRHVFHITPQRLTLQTIPFHLCTTITRLFHLEKQQSFTDAFINQRLDLFIRQIDGRVALVLPVSEMELENYADRFAHLTEQTRRNLRQLTRLKHGVHGWESAVAGQCCKTRRFSLAWNS